jgi:hypothetical protein
LGKESGVTIDTRSPEGPEYRYAVIGGTGPQPLKLTHTEEDAMYEADKIIRSDKHPFVYLAKVEKVVFAFCYNCGERSHRTEECQA